MQSLVRPLSRFRSRLPFALRLAPSASASTNAYSTALAENVKGLTQRLAFRDRHAPSIADLEDVEHLSSSTIGLVNIAADPPFNWYKTTTLRSDSELIRQQLPQPSRLSSDAEERFQETHLATDSDYDLLDNLDIELSPGTFVELRWSGNWTQGILLGEIHFSGDARLVVMNSSGLISTHKKADVQFSVPAVVESDMAERCGLERSPLSGKEAAARVQVLKRIREFELGMEDVLVQVGRDGHGLYKRVRSQDPNQWVELTLTEATSAVAPRATVFSTFAVHKLLISRPDEFAPDDAYRLNGKIYVRPLSHLQLIREVGDMVRSKDHKVQNFVFKCLPIIAANQQIASTTFTAPPTTTVSRKQCWNSDEKRIITFLLHSLRPSRLSQANPYQFGSSTIVKMLYPDTQQVSEDHVHRLLVDLGVMAPWQDLVSSLEILGLDQAPPETSEQFQKAQKLTRDALAARSTVKSSGQTVLGPTDLHPTDPLHDLRHDFGQADVYVIDDPTAQELDDGFSVEAIPSEPNNYWVHIHIADPAALMPPTHVFAEQAHKMVETAYFIHRTWPMLPPALMEELSLGNGAKRGEPERVLTFSGKVNERGELVDYKVRAGLVRKINVVHYDSVDKALGKSIFTPKPLIGESRIKSQQVLELPSIQRESLEMLRAVADRLVQARLRQDVFHCAIPKAEVSFNQYPLYTNPIDLSVTSTFQGFPGLNYELRENSSETGGSREMVAELMKLACRVASLFFRDHNVPAVRRCTSPGKHNKFEKLLALRNSSGIISFEDHIRYRTVQHPGEFTTETKAHWGLGVAEGEGYCRVTSPLRRYSDLVLHWQLHSVLLNPLGSPQFSMEWMREYARDTTFDTTRHKLTTNTHSKFWALTALKRWMENPATAAESQAALKNLCVYPDVEGVVNPFSMHMQTKCICPTLGLTGLLEGSVKTGYFTPGQPLPVKIKSITLGTRPSISFAPLT